MADSKLPPRALPPPPEGPARPAQPYVPSSGSTSPSIPAPPRPSSGSTSPSMPASPRPPGTGSTSPSMPAPPRPVAPRPPGQTGSQPPVPRTAPGLGGVPPVAEALTQLNEYRILRALGRGGMAHVYLGQRPDGRLAAIKLLLPQFAQDQEIVRRFLLEMKATASLRHEHVIEILDFGDWRGNYYLATEYMDAGSLRDLVLRAAGRLPPPTALALTAMLLRALGAAHAQNLVHRDVKPANVLLRSDGTAKLGDFGIARALDLQGLTKTGLLMGTPAYMSPEQARGDKVDGRSDLFSAGVLLYELIAGFNPFAGQNEAASLTKVLTSEAPMLFEVNPALPPYLEPLVARLLARDVSDRYASADEAIADIVRAVPQAMNGRELVREALVDPLAAWRRWSEGEAQTRFSRAEMLLEQGPARRPLAILELFRAHALAPKSTAAETRLRELFQGRDPFAPAGNPKIAELEHELARNPTSHALLMQLAALYKLELQLVKSIACYKRALRIRPDDGFAAGQLKTLIGEEADSSIAGGHLTLKTMPGRDAPPTLPPDQVAPRRTAQVTPTPLYTPPVDTRSDFQRALPKIITIAVIVLVVGGLVRAAGNFIRKSQADLDSSTESLRKGMQGRSDAPPSSADVEARARAMRDSGEAEFAAAAQQVEGPNAADAVAKLRKFRDDHPKSPKAQEAAFFIAKGLVTQQLLIDAGGEIDRYLETNPREPTASEARLIHAKCLAARADSGAALAEYRLVETSGAQPRLVLQAIAGQARLHETRNELDEARAKWRDLLARTSAGEPLNEEARLALARLGG